MRTAPNSPLSISARRRRTGASNEWLWPTTRCTPARSRRRDHRGAFVKRQRHRLFDQQMLAVPRGEHRVLGVKLMRRRHIDDLDRRVGAQLLDGLRSSCAAKSAAKRCRASARGSAAATSATRGSPVKVGSITLKARPRPATPSRSLRSISVAHRSVRLDKVAGIH